MPETVTVEIYQFDELSDAAKETARGWWREDGLFYDWWDASYEDFLRIAEIFGIAIKNRQYHVNGERDKPRTEPCIFFSGFYSQGDGAHFEGTYEYAKGCTRAIRRYAPNDTALHAIADRLLAVQKKYRYCVVATVEHHGFYEHEMCTEINVDVEYPNGNVINDIIVADDAEIVDTLREFMRWIYKSLETEHEYLLSDEQVDESISANEYTFYEDGTRSHE